MADIELIKPRELPAITNAQPTDAVMLDNGVTVGKVTPEQLVNAGAAVASEAEALAGVNNTKRMTPLRVRQVLDNVNNPAVLRAQAWAESTTPPDPLLPDSKSAKTWASIAEQGVVMVQWSMIAADGQAVLGDDITTGEPIRAFGGVAQISVNGFGPITPEEYSVDSDGVITLTAPLAEGDVVSGFTQPRLTNSEAQAVVQGVLQQTGADVAAAQEAAARAELFDGPKVDVFSELSSVTPPEVPPEEFVRVVQDQTVYRATASDAPPHSSDADGYWQAPGMPALVKVRGEQIPSGGFDLRQFGAKCNGSDDSDAINYSILIASETAKYTSDPDNFQHYLSAPIRVPSGQVGFSETITMRANAQLWGGGMVNTMFRRLGGDGHSFATVDFDYLDANPMGPPLMPGALGMRDMTIVDGDLNDFDNTAESGYGLAMYAYNVCLRDVQVYAPKRSKGLYMAKTMRSQILTNSDLISASQSPFLIEEDICDGIMIKRSGGDGFTWGSNDAHLGRIWAITNKGAGVVLNANSLQGSYIHAYSNHGWNIIFDGPVHDFKSIEARDGRRGGVWFKDSYTNIGHMRVGNNLRGLEDGESIPVEEQCDVRVSNRNITIKDGWVRVSAGKVGIRYDGSQKETEINALVSGSESGAYAGQGIAAQFTTSNAQNKLNLRTRSFNHADAVGVDFATGGVQFGMDLNLNVATESAVAFTAIRSAGDLTRSRIDVTCNSAQITAVKGGAGSILATTEFSLKDLAANPQYSRFQGATANFTVDSTGVRNLTISVPGGWVGGQLPVVDAGQIQAHVQPNGSYNDFEITPVRVTTSSTSINLTLAVRTASATVGATARVNVIAFIGSI